jgi:hypothetical protein
LPSCSATASRSQLAESAIIDPRDRLHRISDTPGSTVHADEASHWDALEARFLTKRINHSVEYANAEANTNMAESFFSRLRRAEIGTHHRIAGRYLHAYAQEMAWREDNRRISNGEQFLLATASALDHPVSRQWKGYWQR